MEWRTVQGSQVDKPKEMDTTSSSSLIYMRRNIKRITIDNGVDPIIELWEYEEKSIPKDSLSKDFIKVKDFYDNGIWCFNKVSEVVGELITEEEYEIITGLKYDTELNRVVSKKKSELKKKRDILEMEPIEVDGYLFDYDDKARERLDVAREVIKITHQPIKWTLAENNEVTDLTEELSDKIMVAVAVRSNQLHVQYRQFADQVYSIASDDNFTEQEKIDKIKKIEWN